MKGGNAGRWIGFLEDAGLAILRANSEDFFN